MENCQAISLCQPLTLFLILGAIQAQKISKKLQSFMFTQGLRFCSYQANVDLTVDDKHAVLDV